MTQGGCIASRDVASSSLAANVGREGDGSLGGGWWLSAWSAEWGVSVDGAEVDAWWYALVLERVRPGCRSWLSGSPSSIWGLSVSGGDDSEIPPGGGGTIGGARVIAGGRASTYVAGGTGVITGVITGGSASTDVTGGRLLMRKSPSRVSDLVFAPVSGVRGEGKGMIRVRSTSQVTFRVVLV